MTIPLLREAWKSCQQNENRGERNALLDQMERPEPEPVTAKQIDALDVARWIAYTMRVWRSMPGHTIGLAG